MRLIESDGQVKIDTIEKWKNSGLSQKESYQQENIPAEVFYYWHKCYRDQQHKKPKKSTESFTEVTSTDSASSMEVCLPDGTRIIFNEPVSADFLKVLTW